MSTSLNNQSRLLTCKVNDQWLALSVDKLSEVVTPQPRTKVPLSPPAVNGLINLRGKILTELDLRQILNLPNRKNPDEYRSIIVESGEGEDFGLTVDSVGEVIVMDSKRFEVTPDSLEACWRNISLGVLKQDNRILVILDVAKIIAISIP